MFFVLRRICQALLLVFALAICAWLYWIGAHEPLVDAAAILYHREETIETVEVTGTVTRVGADGSVQLRGDEGRLYAFGLAGVTLEPAAESEALSNQDLLKGLMLSNRLRVAATLLTPQGAGLGLFYVNSTNVNAYLIRTGRAKLNRDYVKRFPVLEQYRLVRALRLAQSGEEERLSVQR